MSDYYNILGVDRKASDADLKKAYKKASMQHHPDRGGDEEQFKKVNEAYATLKDPGKRQMYDQYGTADPQQAGPQGFDFHFNSSNFGGRNPFAGTPFADMFGGANPFQNRQPRNQDMRIAAQIDLKDVLVGKNLVVQIRLGSGRTETLNIDVPPGAKDGDTIQYEGLGDDTNPRLQRGNLHVVIKVTQNAGWQRSNNDLITKKVINLFDLLLGCVIIVNTLDGRNIKVNIPKGTNPGQRFSIQGYGIPDINTGHRGSIYVIVDVETPTITNENVLNKIKQIKKEIE